ncbi:MAG: septum formation initiator family protein [candidate division NC10 bacterium]|nr:septum formation initiator family protein [candidate division NC10 bacterium]
MARERQETIRRGSVLRERRGKACRYLLFATCVFLFILLVSLFSSRGLLSLYRLYCTEQHLQHQIAELKSRNAALREELWAWENDPSRIEMIARDELGLVKPGELIYQFGAAGPS